IGEVLLHQVVNLGKTLETRPDFFVFIAGSGRSDFHPRAVNPSENCKYRNQQRNDKKRAPSEGHSKTVLGISIAGRAAGFGILASDKGVGNAFAEELAAAPGR